MVAPGNVLEKTSKLGINGYNSQCLMSFTIEFPRMFIVRSLRLFFLDFGGLLLFPFSVPVGVELESSVLSYCSHSFPKGSYLLDVSIGIIVLRLTL